MPKHHPTAKTARRAAGSRRINLRAAPKSAPVSRDADLRRSRAVLRPAHAQARSLQAQAGPVQAQAQSPAGPAPAFDEATLMRLVADMRRAKGTYKGQRSDREQAALAATVAFELRYAVAIGLALYLYSNPELYTAIVAYVTDMAAPPETTLAQN